MSNEATTRPPRDDLFRGLFGTLTLEPRADGSPIRAVQFRAGPDGENVLFGHFAVFNVWTEIDSWYEGRFLERLAPGAFKKTLKERGDRARCLFQHGYDFVVGDKPLGPFRTLSEDETGVYYEVPMLDTQYCAEIIPGLRENLYGASFRFRVMREEMVEDPGVSEWNPKGLPERTIKELELYEGGPVTFGAYPEATAGMRSLTDEFLVERMARHPERLKEIVEARNARRAEVASRNITVEISGDAETLAAALIAPSEDDAASRADSAPVVEPDESRDASEANTEAPAVKATPKVTKDYLAEGITPPWFLS